VSARARRLAKRALLGIAVLLALTALSLAWLLRSGGGRDFALARLLAALPPGALSWQRVEGTLAGPLVLHGVRYANDGLVVEVQRVALDLAPGALAARTVHVQALTLENGRVQLPPGEQSPTPWPAQILLPDALPPLALPVSILLDALHAENLRLEQASAEVLVLRRIDAVGRFERGRLALQRLEIDSDRGTLRAQGDLDSADRWRSGLQARVELADAGGGVLPLALELSGTLEDLTLQATAALPEPATLKFVATGGLPDPHLSLQLHAPQVDPSRFGGEGEPLALELRVEGDLHEVQADGRLQRGDLAVQLEPSKLRYRSGVFELAPLSLALSRGRASATGSVDLKPAEPLLALDLAWQDVRPPSSDGAAAVVASGTARLDGALDDYALTLQGTLQREAETAQLALQGRGTRESLRFDTLTLQTPRGQARAQGRVHWSPQIAWDLDAALQDFDPGFLAPDFPGAVDAQLVSQGSVVDGQPQGLLRLDPLGGELRGRALAGRVEAQVQLDRSGRAEADLRIGGSHLVGAGRWNGNLDANVHLEPLDLADLLPDLAGELRGRVQLSGARERPAIDADLAATALAVPGFAAESVRLRARVEQFDHGSLGLEAQRVELGGQRFGSLSLSGEGSRAQHELALALRDGVADLALELAGGETDAKVWRGSLRALRVEPRERPAWALRAPATLAYGLADGTVQLGQACLAESTQSLCVDADWSEHAGRAHFAIEQFALATLDPVLADALGMPVSASGTLSASGDLRRAADGTLGGTLEARSARGELRLDPQSERQLLVYENLRADARLEAARLHADASASLAQGGRLDARLDAGTAADGTLDGRIEAQLRDLTFLELFSDQWVDPKGRLDASLALTGTRADPALAGNATLADFSAELPGLGLNLSEGRLELRSRGAQAAELRGQLRSGQGVLRIEGFYDAAAAAEQTLALSLKGDTVTVAGLPELTAAASPDLELSLKQDKLRLRGTIEVPLARLELERLQTATRPSSDVVIVDAESAAATQPGLALDSDVTVKLGDDITLDGFGLKGKVSGQLAVRDRPGRATVARGGVEVTGEYKAYGQDLQITRGRLAYASTPIDNPSLDIRAQREIDDITVGVQVRGTALAPELTLWSNPALDQAEQLSYLVLGRPLRSASQADGAQLSQAAAAIGGNLLAKRLGTRLGLHEVGVADNRALGGAALTVGKYLSPKLYVSYGMALFGTGQVVTFKYLLSRVWSVQIDSGTENRAALNYRLER
jgi:translocation and assembly module TamB